jgi:polysaccharide pyruvyl transferase WcaK-like protein
MGKLLIVGGDADSNVGDTAILVALARCVAAERPEMELTIVSDRRDWNGLLPDAATVIPRGPRGLPALLRAAAGHDLVLVGGGGLFQDDDSRVKMPYWAARIAMLRVLNPNIAGHALGAGPLEHAESRRCARLACDSLRRVSVRDRFAQRWLQRCMREPLTVVPDSAFMLEPAPAEEARSFVRALGLSPDRPLIGVAVRRWFHRRGGFLPHRLRAAAGMDRGDGDTEMTRLIAEIATSLRSIARRMDASVLLMPSYHAAHEGDMQSCQRLLSQLGGVEAKVASISDPRLYKAVAGQTKLMISARMHPLILAAGMGVPIVALAYNGKFDGLLDLLNLGPASIWLEEFRQDGRAAEIERLAAAALNHPQDLQHRAARLGEIARLRTRVLLEELVPA